MIKLRRSPADESARLTVEVRDPDGALMPRISQADAETLHRRAWAEWIGSGSRRYLRLMEAAPLARIATRRTPGTRRDRADGTCRVYAPGQAFGGPSLVEHIPSGGGALDDRH